MKCDSSEEANMKKNTAIKASRGDRLYYILITVFSIIVLITVLYPLIYVVSSSFSSGSAVTNGKVILWPVNPSIQGYKVILGNHSVGTGYYNTVLNSVIGTALGLAFTVMMAYPLARKNLHGRGFLMVLWIIPMFFYGGLIPGYILKTKLHIVNTRWAVIQVGMITTYNMTIVRTFFENSIPNELYEASRIDGISDIGYLIKIVLPLSKAVLAVITLYLVVNYWNNYFQAMIYLRDPSLKTLPLVLREILNASQMNLTDYSDPELLAQMQEAADVMKYALIVVSTVPLMVGYIFVQKFFDKGVMIGALKG